MGKDIRRCEFIKHKKSFIFCLYQLTISLWGTDAKGYLSTIDAKVRLKFI